MKDSETKCSFSSFQTENAKASFCFAVKKSYEDESKAEVTGYIPQLAASFEFILVKLNITSLPTIYLCHFHKSGFPTQCIQYLEKQACIKALGKYFSKKS